MLSNDVTCSYCAFKRKETAHLLAQSDNKHVSITHHGTARLLHRIDKGQPGMVRP